MSQDRLAQFIMSPYADTFVKVLLKGNSITWVHRGVIPGHVLSSKSTIEPGSNSATSIMDMQDIGNDTAHVIIHFFYTKQYNCITPWGIPGDTAKGYELRVSLQVIEAARKMKLPALEDLAKRQCARVCNEMDLLNLVAILGKINIDTKNFPELAQHISLHLEKVLTNPHSQVASNLLSRTTTNSITDILVRKLVMNARDKPTGEPKAKPGPENETPDMPPCPSRPQTPSQDSVTAKPESSQLTDQRRTQQPQEVVKNPHPGDKGKGRDISKQVEQVLKATLPTALQQEPRLTNAQQVAQSGPSRVRGWRCPFSPPCGRCADAEKKDNPLTPTFGSSIASMKDFVAAEKSSAVDWEVPKSEAEQSQKSESFTLVDSDDEGVIVDSETQPTVTPSPEDSGYANKMNLFYAYDRW
ncbi:hypothetical protein FMUND_11892 [Fusarium mundagurra]|uniref:BTB domain-containing protein n=1 Tax=Fusarium mundagurra TaxID=1567541 RepID=A0A8H5Y6B3_9HYPO|nr:hypothetical protein FMUND_11892 [Fusarium mundagurra]